VFLDFVASFGVLNTGHGHPRVVEAIKKQAEKMVHLMGAINPTRADLFDALTEITPGKGPKRVLFGAGGGEAVDMAIRLVRYYGKKYEVFAFYGAYHGRPSGAMSLMGKGYGRRGFHPVLAGAVHVPYAYCYRCPFDLLYPDCSIACARFVENAVKGQSTGVAEPAAIIVEPIQGNGGMIPAPPEFLQELPTFLLVDLPQAGKGFGDKAGREEGLSDSVVQVSGQPASLLHCGQSLRLFIEASVFEGNGCLAGQGLEQCQVTRIKGAGAIALHIQYADYYPEVGKDGSGGAHMDRPVRGDIHRISASKREI